MRKIVERIAIVWAIAGGIILFAITLVTVANVGAFALDRIARAYGGTVAGLTGYEDFVRLVISAAALMFFPYCQMRKGHVAVDLFANLFPARVQAALGQAVRGLTVALALFLAYWMTFGLWETRSDQAVSGVLGWSQWPFYVPGIFSLLLWAAVAAAGDREGNAP